MADEKLTAATRIEKLLDNIAGGENEVTPATRLEKFLSYIADAMEGGGGGSGCDCVNCIITRTFTNTRAADPYTYSSNIPFSDMQTVTNVFLRGISDGYILIPCQGVIYGVENSYYDLIFNIEDAYFTLRYTPDGNITKLI